MRGSVCVERGGGKKIPATDEQATIDGFLHVREIRTRISGGGMRLIVR